MHSELSRLLEGQGRVVTSAQALTFLTRRGLEAQLNNGELQRIWHGIYGRGEVNTPLRLRGLDLAAGTTVVACMGTAAAAYGFDTERTETCTCSIRPGDNCGQARASSCTGARMRR